MRQMLWVSLLMGGALFWASGCRVNQEKEVQTYRSVLDGGAAAKPATYSPDEPLSLERALELVNRHNERLAIRGEDYLQALINKDRAVAAFLPTVSFAPSHLREQPTHIPLANEFFPPNVTDAPIEAELNVDIPRSLATARAADAAARRQRELLLDYQATVFLDASQTYYQILRSERQVEFLVNSVAVQQARLANIRLKESAGTARPLDVSQVEAQLAGTRAQLIAAENDVRNGRAVLALVLGVERVNGPLTDRLQVPEGVSTEEELMAAARRNRRDLKAAIRQTEVAQRNLEAAWSRYFPSVGLSGTYFPHRESLPDDVTWLSMVQINLPIFTAGLIHADVRTAYSQLRQAVLAESYLEREILKDLRVDRQDIEDSARRLGELRVQVTAAENALNVSEQSYAAGLATNLDRLIAQDQVLQAGLNLAGEELTRKIYYLRLLRATGRLDLKSPESGLKMASKE